MLQDTIANRDSALFSVWRKAFVAHLPLWIVMHEDLTSTRRMRIVFDVLDAGLALHVNAGARSSKDRALKDGSSAMKE